jgi:hypothetical protein
MDKYHGIKLGEFSKEKENFWFGIDTRSGRLIFVRQSEWTLRKVIKDLERTGEIMNRDKSYWWSNGSLVHTKCYKPRY